MKVKERRKMKEKGKGGETSSFVPSFSLGWIPGKKGEGEFRKRKKKKKKKIKKKIKKKNKNLPKEVSN